MQLTQAVARLKAAGSPANVAGKARYGIDVRRSFGVAMPDIRALAKEIGRDHALAMALWDTGIPDCRLLAPMVADLAQTDEALLERWVDGLSSWDVCDGLCANLIDRHPRAWTKAAEWSTRQEEFVRRAGYVLMARLSVRDKKAPDESFLPFLPLIEAGASDVRPMVKKAVSWALRQIGKRDEALRQKAMACARRLGRQTAHWIARDVLRELEDSAQVQRIAARTAARRTGRN
jgi:3-methyladenine DNA glycosylase AlkD